MSYNAGFKDTKPSNQTFTDTKPNNITVSTDTEQSYTMTLGAGMWLGFSAITYPSAITIQSPKSP